MATQSDRGGRFPQLYYKNCEVCQFMKKTPAFRLRAMQSRYFNPRGFESLSTVVHDFGDPFPMANVYMHMRRHQEGDMFLAKRRYAEAQKNKPGLMASQLPTVPVGEAVEGQVFAQSDHEVALDEFIRKGREKMLREEMHMTATNFLAAIKIRTEIDKSAKDRRLDMIKSFFTGGNKNGQKEDGGPVPTEG